MDDYLFLLVDEGREHISDLHAQIYSGVLADLKQTDLPYVPHVTLGMFADNESGCLQALDEAKQCDLNYHCVLDRLHLLKINDRLTRVLSSKEFLLI